MSFDSSNANVLSEAQPWSVLLPKKNWSCGNAALRLRQYHHLWHNGFHPQLGEDMIFWFSAAQQHTWVCHF